MPIDYTCPHCGSKSVVADEYAGQSGPCANCGQTITVPREGVAAPPSRPPSGGMGTGTIVAIVIVGGLLGLLACGGLMYGTMYAVLSPAIGEARESARRAQCKNNLKQIGLAMHNYHDANGKLPPAYQTDSNGKPMHSWRLLIAPYMEAGGIYNAYDLQQAWDSQANKGIQSLMPQSFRCPSSPQGAQVTDYVVVTGAETIFDGDKAASFRDITDGTSNTIMVVEAAGMDVPWTEPRDLDFNQMSMAIGSQPGNSVNSHHAGGAHVLMADGSVRFLKSDLPPAMLRALLTKAGGEVVGEF